jgi:cutinase
VLVASALGAPVVDHEKRQSCSALKLVHVAGTTETGLGVVGTPLAAALASSVPGCVAFLHTHPAAYH